MLPRRLRISRAAFTNTGKEMRVVSPHFSVSMREGTPGAAVIISKKVEKTSVGRHRLKRRVVAAIEHHLPLEAALFIYARAGAAQLPYAAIREELTSLLHRLSDHSAVR